jgi:hypothetical protein
LENHRESQQHHRTTTTDESCCCCLSVCGGRFTCLTRRVFFLWLEQHKTQSWVGRSVGRSVGRLFLYFGCAARSPEMEIVSRREGELSLERGHVKVALLSYIYLYSITYNIRRKLNYTVIIWLLCSSSCYCMLYIFTNKWRKLRSRERNHPNNINKLLQICLPWQIVKNWILCKMCKPHIEM